MKEKTAHRAVFTISVKKIVCIICRDRRPTVQRLLPRGSWVPKVTEGEYECIIYFD